MNLPLNRRKNETLRRYVLAGQMVAAVAEMMLAEDDHSPYARALRHAIEAQDMELERLRRCAQPAPAAATVQEPAAPSGIYAEILAHGLHGNLDEGGRDD